MSIKRWREKKRENESRKEMFEDVEILFTHKVLYPLQIREEDVFACTTCRELLLG